MCIKRILKQKAFADYFIETGNAYQSAIKAGYSENYAKGNVIKLLENESVKQYIEERMKEIESERIAKAEEVLAFLVCKYKILCYKCVIEMQICLKCLITSVVETILVFLCYNLNMKNKENLYKRGGFMYRPDHLPESLDKETLTWLRAFGYTLNSPCDRMKKIKENFKKWYTYEYYFYVDIDLAQEARKKFESLTVDDFNSLGEYYKSENRITNQEKRRLIKELYGLEKKGIR